MTRQLRRELRILRAYAFVTSIVLAGLSVAAYRQAEASQRFGEVTVERLNVVDANGTLRLVISNKDRMHPGIIDGKTIDRPRPVAGLLFFNDRGDEVGGLTFTGQEVAGKPQANAGIMFDQFRQDQTIGFSYSERDGRRTAGLQVWDRSDTPLGELIEKLNAANRLTDSAARESGHQGGARCGAAGTPARIRRQDWRSIRNRLARRCRRKASPHHDRRCGRQSSNRVPRRYRQSREENSMKP